MNEFVRCRYCSGPFSALFSMLAQISKKFWLQTFYLFILSVYSSASFYAASVVEYQVKAAFIYNFAKFTEWPQDKAAKTPSTFSICILGKDPFGDTIDSLLEGRSIAKKTIKIVRLSADYRVQECDILFIGQLELNKVIQALAQVGSLSILTIAEIPNFLSLGGMIRFYIHNQTVRFKINQSVVNRNHLRIDARVLELENSWKKEASNADK